MRLRSRARTTMVVALAALAIALAVALGILRLSQTMTSTEEPPIRVKNGSEDIVVSFDAWEQDQPSDKKNWHLKSTTRKKDGLDLVVLYSGTACTGGWASAKKIRVEYKQDTDTNGIDISSPGKKIKVKSDKDLSVSTSGDTIGYGAPQAGFINRIVLDDDNLHPFCTFNSASDLGQLFIFDW